MEHPLLALARAYDRAVPSEGHTLRDEVESWLETEPAEAVVAYAAHFSVLTQTCQLGRHGIWEEPQTDALYGLLASSLWHAQVLDDAYLVCQERDNEYPRKRYWVHQNKKQEAQSGYDFGIVTPFGENNVKITLFQAKRPRDEAEWKQISLSHEVRKKTGQTPPDGTPAKEQQKAITAIKEWIEGGAKGDDIPSFLDDCGDGPELRENVLRHGPGSLFYPPFSYLQCDVFLATALRGWLDPNAQTLSGGWCHYVQWVNRNAGAPWSVTLEDALATGGSAYKCRKPFAQVLTAALSSFDGTIGLRLERTALNAFTGIINGLLPGLAWGSVADQPEIANALLYDCGVAPEDISPSIGEAVAPAADDVDLHDGPSRPRPGPGLG